MSEIKFEDFPPLKDDSNHVLVKRLNSSFKEIQSLINTIPNLPLKKFEYEIKRIETFANDLKNSMNDTNPIDKLLAPFKERFSQKKSEFPKPNQKDSFDISFDQSEKCFSMKSEYRSNQKKISKPFAPSNHFENNFEISENFELPSSLRVDNDLDPLFARDTKLQEIRKRIFTRNENKSHASEIKKNYYLAEKLNTRESIREVLNKENELSFNSNRGINFRKQDKEDVKRDFNQTLRSMRKSSRNNSISSTKNKREETPLARDSFLSSTYSSKKKNSNLHEGKLKAWNTRMKTSFEARFSQFKYR